MDLKTIREFHWLTKTVILLTGLVFVMLMTTIITTILGMTNLSQGLGFMLLSMVSIMAQLFPIILVIILLCIAGARIKEWIEKYMDAMLAKMDLLAAGNATGEDSNARLAVMSSRIEEIDKKVNNISDILEKVSE